MRDHGGSEDLEKLEAEIQRLHKIIQEVLKLLLQGRYTTAVYTLKTECDTFKPSVFVR